MNSYNMNSYIPIRPTLPTAGKDKGAKGVVAAKDKHTQANDDEGALGGNAAVDKCARGGQSKDNSGGGGAGAG
jgi:hypothetical protein